MNRRVAVIDVGSNSIKVLVAESSANGSLLNIASRTIDARISRGIACAHPTLGEEGMAAGLKAIRSLHKEAVSLGAQRIRIVGTSAVRDAANGADFRRRVAEATGCELQILGGDDEARLIGRGLRSDPALSDLCDFYVFDLGGGSMECLSFAASQPRQELSLQLGCVRLTEAFVTAPSAPLPSSERQAIFAHVLDTLSRSGFRFDLPGAPAVFTGGSMTTARAVFAKAAGLGLEHSPSVLEVERLSALADRICSLSLEERKRGFPGLAAERADVFPAALVTILAVARAAGVARFRHSLHNLRYGLAAELLDKWK
jgi:exopolyphosphatase/guanosine-5'-triphosphate,3'-diphosphate pyrophosphatase